MEAYDWAASFSIVEHIGLGRFGEALDPNGDLTEVKKIYCMLKKEGYFFLGVRLGFDSIYTNWYRIYGRVRLALLLAGLSVLVLISFP